MRCRQTEPFTACVLGDTALRDALERTVKGRQLSGRAIGGLRGSARREAALLPPPLCLGRHRRRITAIVAALGNAPVLTISDLDDFAQLGGMAQLFVENGQMRFDLEPRGRQARPAGAQLQADRAGRARSWQPERDRTMTRPGERPNACDVKTSKRLVNWMQTFGLVLATIFVLAPAGRVGAQQPLPDLSLEELMRIDAGRVFGASERLQPVTEAPASVSFITADEIARYGYRTLADILRGVRGMYVTDDRNFSFLGTRGFGQAGRLQQPDPAAGQRTPGQRQRLRPGGDRRRVRHRRRAVRARRDHPRPGLVALRRQRLLRASST